MGVLVGLPLRSVITARVCPEGSKEGCPASAFISCSTVLHKPLSCRQRTRRQNSAGICVTYAGSSNDTSDKARPSLTHICHRIEFCFFEVCVRNLGRPAGLSLHGFVSATVEAFSSGYTREQVSLQLAFGSAGMHEFEVGTAGSRLTATEERYRSKWLDTVYTTLQILHSKDHETSGSSITDDMHLYSTIRHVLEGQVSGDEQSLVNFDRGLATKGASGGVVADKAVIAPQWVPVSQLVLLTLKVRVCDRK
eukprot:c18705_g1_i1 orf=557-1309(-)